MRRDALYGAGFRHWGNNRWLLPVRVSDAYVRPIAWRQQREHAAAGRQMDTPEVSFDTLVVMCYDVM